MLMAVPKVEFQAAIMLFDILALDQETFMIGFT